MYIVIAGAGLVGTGLAKALCEARHDVVVVEQDKGVCEQVGTRTGALALHGIATDIGIIEQAGINKADVAVGTMRDDADNLAFGLLAKSFDVPRVVARMRDPRYASAYEKAGVTATIHVVDIFVNQLLLDIESPHLRQVATFGGGKASIVVDTVPDRALAVGKTVGEIAADPDFPSRCVITGIYRAEGQEFIIPRGQAQVQCGDRLFLVAARRDLATASKFLHKTK